VRENSCRPTGLVHLFHFTRHFRAGLSYPAAMRLEFWWCLLHRLRSMIALTQSLEAPLQNKSFIAALKALRHPESSFQKIVKPSSFMALGGAAEAAPFQGHV